MCNGEGGHTLEWGVGRWGVHFLPSHQLPGHTNHEMVCNTATAGSQMLLEGNTGSVPPCHTLHCSFHSSMLCNYWIFNFIHISVWKNINKQIKSILEHWNAWGPAKGNWVFWIQWWGLHPYWQELGCGVSPSPQKSPSHGPYFKFSFTFTQCLYEIMLWGSNGSLFFSFSVIILCNYFNLMILEKIQVVKWEMNSKTSYSNYRTFNARRKRKIIILSYNKI